MKTLLFQNKEDWLEARKGRITGSRLKDIIVKRGTEPKIGFYELIAERLAISPDGENAMDRGVRLEEEAIGRFAEETKKKIDTSLVIWTREDNENIAISPDGFVGEKEAVEAKCLSSAEHIETYLTRKVPSEYEMQAIQYFIVNEKLERLYFSFYDPRMTGKLQFFFLEIKREEVSEKIDEYLAYQQKTLEEVYRIVNELTF